MRFAIAALAAVALAGCSDGPYSEQEKSIKVEMVRHFAELNAQAGERAQQTKGTKTDIDLAPTALTINRYEWDIAGFVYPDVVCHGCQAKLGKLATTGADIRCPNCGLELLAELTRVGRGQPMFEIKSASNATPIVVIVRYIRRSLAYDPNSAVMVSAKAEAAFPIKSYTDAEHRGQGAYYAGGFYRVTGSAICTTGFVYRGGALNQIDPDSVKKMVKDPPETVAVPAMKLGRWGAVEEPWTPWLGNPPAAAAAKDAPKSE